MNLEPPSITGEMGKPLPKPPNIEDTTSPVQYRADPPDERGRTWWNVGVVKISHGERDLARRVMPDEDSARDRKFTDILGADTEDDHEEFPASSPESLAAARAARDAGEKQPWRHLDGARTVYSLGMTEQEAKEWFPGNEGSPSNVRYVEPDSLHWPR